MRLSNFCIRSAFFGLASLAITGTVAVGLNLLNTQVGVAAGTCLESDQISCEPSNPSDNEAPLGLDVPEPAPLPNGGNFESFSTVESADTPGGRAVPVGACANNPNKKNCDGQDPITQGCNADAKTVLGGNVNIKDGNTTIGTVELRFSKKCQSNWTKVTSSVGAKTLFGQIGRANNSRIGGAAYNAQFNNVTSMYTDMVYAPDATKDEPAVKASAYGRILINGRWIVAYTPFI